MKVLFVVRNIDRYSGAATQALNLAKEFNKNNYEISILNVTDKDNSASNIFFEGIQIFNIPRGNTSLLLFVNIVRKFDIIHYHGMFLNHLVISKLLGKKTILKTTLTGEDDFESISNRRFGRLRILLLNFCIDLNNSLTKELGRINSKYIAKNKIITLPNYVNCGEVNFKKANNFVFVGALVKRKNPLKSIEYFINNYIDVENSRLYIIGPTAIEESNGDLLYAKEILHLANRFPDKIILTGNLKHSEVIEIYKSSKALLFFSDREGMPNCVLEAMAQNCVPIVSSIGGVAFDIINNGTDGFIIDPDQDTGISIDLVDNLISEGKPLARIKCDFSFDVGYKSYKKLYENMMNKRIKKNDER
jgi:glycosyltransferase involved in cell wall biosynthesis